jgi:hypothetical protein
MDKM